VGGWGGERRKSENKKPPGDKERERKRERKREKKKEGASARV
jgi:hypothetical protein